MTDPKPTRGRKAAASRKAPAGDLETLFADFEAELTNRLPEGLARDKALRKVASVRKAALMAVDAA